MAPSNSTEVDLIDQRPQGELENQQQQQQRRRQELQQEQQQEQQHEQNVQKLSQHQDTDDEDSDGTDSGGGKVAHLLPTKVLKKVRKAASKTTGLLGIHSNGTGSECDMANSYDASSSSVSLPMPSSTRSAAPPPHSQTATDPPSVIHFVSPGRSVTLPISALDDKHRSALNSSTEKLVADASNSITTEPFHRNDGSAIHSEGRDSADKIPDSFHNNQPYDRRDSVGPLDNNTDDGDDDGSNDYDDDASSINLSYANEKRLHDFHALFRSVPEDEKLIEDYGCALQKEILVQGRLYVSENHVCFNANIFGWVTNLVIAFSEITAIEKRVTAFVIPNAISIITTNNTKGHFFASFLSRDAAYDLLMAAWRKSFPCPANASAVENNIYLRNEKSTTTLNDDANDNESFISARPPSATRKGRHRSSSSASHTWTPDEAEMEKEADFDSKSTHNSHRHSKRAAVRKIFKDGHSRRERSSSEAPLPPTSIDHRRRDSIEHSSLSNAESAPTALPNNSRSGTGGKADAGGANSNRLPTTCKCSQDGRHYPTTFMTETYPGSVESMWKLMFESDFNKAFLTSEVMKGADVQEEQWRNLPDGKMSRTTKYTKWIGLPIGPKTTKAILTDVCENKDFDDYITVVTTTSTPDVPSGGSFTTKVRTCITWAGPNKVKIVVTGGVEFTKSSWIKGQIEKGAAEGLATNYKELNKSIRKYISEHPDEFGAGGAAAEVKSKASAAQRQADDHSNVAINGADSSTKNISEKATPAPATTAVTEKGGLLSTFTSMLPSAEGDGISQLALVAVLVVIMLINIHIWFRISSVTSQIEKVHVDVISGQQQDHSMGAKSVYKGNGKLADEGFTREQEEAMWAWLTEREERHRQYQRATDRGQVRVQQKDDVSAASDSGKSGDCDTCDDNNDNAGNGPVDFSIAEARLQARINDLQKQLETLERSLELGSQGM
ncbi:hypothetical protein BGX27_004303 [Mortierella sp. AM989]|nr:hypothetical protein BGX27_004303 [Mortierella sp. AM989]